MLRSSMIRGWMRLRLQSASRERCRLRWRPTIRVVRALCTLRFFWRLVERNDYELAGSHCGIQLRPRQGDCFAVFCRASLGISNRARFFVGFGRRVPRRFCSAPARGWPRTTPSFQLASRRRAPLRPGLNKTKVANGRRLRPVCMAGESRRPCMVFRAHSD